MFDMKRYAKIQEYGLHSGGSFPGVISQLCVMQAWSWCVDGNRIEDTIEMGISAGRKDMDYSLISRIVGFNDGGTQGDRDWLLSILPQLPNFDALLAERKARVVQEKGASGSGRGVEEASTPVREEAVVEEGALCGAV